MATMSSKRKLEGVDKRLACRGNGAKTPGGVAPLGAEDAVDAKGVGYFLVM